MAKDRAEQVKKYFKPFPKWTVVFIVVGLPLLALYGAGIIPIALGVLGLLAWKNKPSDRKMDQYVEDDLKRIEGVAIKRTGLDAIDPGDILGDTVVVTGPRFWNTGGAFAGLKKGRDHVIRFSPVGVTVINFTPDQLVAYQCALDLATGNPLAESTDEYFYQDVVSVSTESESLTWDEAMLTRQGKKTLAPLMKGGKLQFNAAQVFILTTSGGNSIKVVLDDPQLIELAGGGTIPTAASDRAIRTVRKMLREKKGH